MKIYYPKITGSLDVSGSTTIFGNLTVSGTISSTTNFNGTSSWAVNSSTASYVANAISSSFSSTASYLNTLNQDLTFNGNLTLNGTASIAYLNVTYESASIIYSSGSNQFGDATNDTQTLIGTTIISGSLQVTGSTNIPNLTGSLFGTASWARESVTASYINPLNQSVEITGSLTVTGSQVELFTDLFRVNTPDGSVNVLVVDSNGVQLFDPSGNQGVAVTLSNRKLYDSASFDSIDWNNRQLIKSDGTTVAFDWENGILTSSLYGTSSWAENAVTASYALTASFALNGGGSTNTGSLLTTASAAGNTITFTKGNGTTFDVSVTGGTNTVYYGSNVSQSFTSQSSWTFNHNLQSQFVIIQALDSNYNQIIPTSITLTGINQATLTFPVSQSGYAIAGLGGNPLSASYALTASYAENAGGSSVKAGEVSSASFGGAPYTASVTFGTAYPNTSYAVVITGEDERIYTVNNKQTTGFTINTNSNVLFSGSVYWQATTYSNS